jgi:hypothetical protein
VPERDWGEPANRATDTGTILFLLVWIGGAYGVTLLMIKGFGDLAYYKAKGGTFQSSLAHDTMARLLTLILGGIPFAMPFFAAAGLGFRAW